MSANTATQQTAGEQEAIVTPTVAAAARDSRILRRPRPLFSDGARALMSTHWYVPCKNAVEWMLALVLFVLALPLILICAALVRLTSRGPAFYAQTRLGRFGVPFRIFKIRTMYPDCEKLGGAQWSRPGDPRITPVGRVLRRLHFDELPQLWNVLRGDMALVGPRPERPEFMPSLEQAIPHYCDRLLIKPGVTGLAQVRLPADTDMNSVRRKLAYDLYYIANIDLWLDLRLIVWTGIHLAGMPYRNLNWLFRIPPLEQIEQVYQDRINVGRRTPKRNACETNGLESPTKTP